MIVIVLILCFLYFQTPNHHQRSQNPQLEIIKNLISKSQKECNLDSYFNRILENLQLESLSNCHFSIHHLSGLLGIYGLSKNHWFLQKSLEIVYNNSDKFKTSSGIPNIGSQNSQNSQNSKIVSVDVFSIYALEFYYLADLTQNFTFVDQVERGLKTINTLIILNRTLDLINVDDPLRISKGLNSIKVSKLYPTLLKLWISTNYTIYKDMYDKSLSLITPFIQSITTMECFFPGMLTQGALLDRVQNWTVNLNLAHNLQQYCNVPRDLKDSRNSNDSGIESHLNCSDGNPLILENFFYMYRLTLDKSWRELGWEYITTFGNCLDDYSLRFAYFLFSDSSLYPLEEYTFSNGFPMAIRGVKDRRVFLPKREESCNDCIEGYGLDSLLNGAFSNY